MKVANVDFTGIAILLGGAIALYAGFRLYKTASNVAPKVTAALNPNNPENLVNRAVTSVYQGVTGSDGTIGGDLYDLIHDTTTKLPELGPGTITKSYRQRVHEMFNKPGSEIDLPYSEFGDASIGDFTSWAKKNSNGSDAYASGF